MQDDLTLMGVCGCERPVAEPRLLYTLAQFFIATVFGVNGRPALCAARLADATANHRDLRT
jgi:hypothetical protein